tara:strand:+ start:2201 stop:2512 length:312 start_codon:yes stop_codon:yes gene_type:complete
MKKTRAYIKHTDATDKMIYEGMERRGNNSQTSAANKLRQEIFRKTGSKMSTSSVQNRYYQLRKERQQNTHTDMDVRGYLIELLTSRDNITLEIQGRKVTAVFK